jgi:alpha-amylase
MLHWALPTQAYVEYQQFEDWLDQQGMADKFGRFVRGGHWRGFLTKYEEANLMHKKMQAVSNRLNSLETNGTADQGQLTAARDRLYAGQCNCSYWHGVFGGLYLPHIRQAVMSSLIEADALLNQVDKTRGIMIRRIDFDADGNDEIVVSGDIFTAVIKPDRGGTLTQLSLNKHCFDPTDTLTRRREGYHADLSRAVTTDKTERPASIHDLILAKESGLERYLVEDWYLKRCFIDHFFTDDVDLKRFQSGRFGEEGDFILEPFTADIEADAQEVRLVRTGNLWRPQGAIPVRLIKTFRFEPDSDQFSVSYDISTPDEREVAVNFAVENNLNFQAGHAEDRFILIDSQRTENAFLDSTRRVAEAESFAIVDEYRNLAVGIQSDRSCELWHLPIFTVSLSEGGFEKVYQGTTFIQLFKLILSPRSININISFRIGQTADFSYTTVSTARAGLH